MGAGSSPAKTAVRAPEGDADDAAIAQAGRDLITLTSELWPERATLLGLHDRDMDLTDRTLEGSAKGAAREQAMLDGLKARFAKASASPASRIDLAILESALAVDIRRKHDLRPLERNPTDYEAPLDAIFAMTAREYAPAPERALNALSRIEKLAPMLDSLPAANLKRPPRIWTTVAMERATGAADFLEQQRPFLEGALPDQKPRIATAIAAAQAAFVRYKAFLEHDVLPRSDGDFAMGRDLFDWMLRENYFLDRNADDLLVLGQKLLDRTLGEMDVVAKRIDPTAKSWPEVTARLKTHHPAAADLIPSYVREVQRARAFLVAKDAVPFPPGDDCQVIATPAFLRTTITAAYEGAPAFDDKTTRGFFFVTPVDPSLSAAKQEQMLRENDYGDEVNTAVHETYPGHHLQLSFARRHPSLIRKATGPDIFSEGWALYSEELMSELGYYTDEERLMQLEWTLARAARVVIDVGLHAKGMSFDDAVKILTDRVHFERELALSEVKRYTMDPTQPLSYLVGREMIFEMRTRMQKRDGQGFSLKSFHEQMLTHGTIAPGLLAKEIFGAAP